MSSALTIFPGEKQAILTENFIDSYHMTL